MPIIEEIDVDEEDVVVDVSCGLLEPVSDPADVVPGALPSKVGGKPAWLIPEHLPPPSELACPSCGVQMVFLLQVHSAMMDLTPDAFYRCIYLFCCKKCNKYCAFRGQLPEMNPYYLPEAAGTDECPAVPKKDAPHDSLCQVCGCLGTKVCSGCHKAHYCCEHHQKMAWRGGHGQVCGKGNAKEEEFGEIDDQGLKFKEFLIDSVDEPEQDIPDPVMDKKIEKLQRQAEEIAKAEAEAKQKSKETMEGEEVLEQATEDSKDIVDLEFLLFQKRLNREPKQALRYMHGNVGAEEAGDDIIEPLWCSSVGRPREEDIPVCEYCGCKRVPEFQLTPQMLYFLEINDSKCGMDFGTLVVYTCGNSCCTVDKSGKKECAYNKEFIWVQMPAPSTQKREENAPPIEMDDD